MAAGPVRGHRPNRRPLPRPERPRRRVPAPLATPSPSDHPDRRVWSFARLHCGVLTVGAGCPPTTGLTFGPRARRPTSHAGDAGSALAALALRGAGCASEAVRGVRTSCATAGALEQPLRAASRMFGKPRRHCRRLDVKRALELPRPSASNAAGCRRRGPPWVHQVPPISNCSPAPESGAGLWRPIRCSQLMFTPGGRRETSGPYRLTTAPGGKGASETHGLRKVRTCPCRLRGREHRLENARPRVLRRNFEEPTAARPRCATTCATVPRRTTSEPRRTHRTMP
jgi:hypothetical protein